MEQILTDNAVEVIKVKWDGERFALTQYYKGDDELRVIILNPKEMITLIVFAGSLGEG